MRCEHCGRDVPQGRYCTNCGAQQGRAVDASAARARSHSYAAHPGEHVAHPGIITTLFPHLGQQKAHEFRLALIAGLVVLFLLYVTGFVSAALIGAAFLVPVLYLIYLYEAQVYRDEPASVLGYTLGAGIVLGVLVTLLTNVVSGPLPVATLGRGGASINLGGLLLIGILVPIVQEVVKPIPALLLRDRPNFSATADGLVFGVAAGLGFALAQSLINLSGAIANLDVRSDPANWIYPLISTAILLPLLQGSATGLITAALWRSGNRLPAGLALGAVVAAVLGHIAFALGTQLLIATGVGDVAWLGWQVLLTGGLLVYVRVLLHKALLDEATEMGLLSVTCPNCHSAVMAAAFCPACGKALSKPTRLKQPAAAAATTSRERV
jgi:ribosomal protein L32